MAQDTDEARRALELAARLAQYPELRARVEEILSVVENEQGVRHASHRIGQSSLV